MKKTFLLILIFVMVLAGCTGKNKTANQKSGEKMVIVLSLFLALNFMIFMVLQNVMVLVLV